MWSCACPATANESVQTLAIYVVVSYFICCSYIYLTWCMLQHRIILLGFSVFSLFVCVRVHWILCSFVTYKDLCDCHRNQDTELELRLPFYSHVLSLTPSNYFLVSIPIMVSFSECYKNEIIQDISFFFWRFTCFFKVHIRCIYIILYNYIHIYISTFINLHILPWILLKYF